LRQPERISPRRRKIRVPFDPFPEFSMIRRLTSFFAGVLTGGVLIYMAMHYHVIHANDGWHLVPKVDGQLTNTFVDIRDYKISDWAQHADIAAARVNANRRDLIDNAVNDTFNSGVDRLLNRETR
jgi:hypothetical protein